MADFADNVVIRFTADQRNLMQGLQQIGSTMTNIGRSAPQINRASQGMAVMSRNSQNLTRNMQQQNRVAAQSITTLNDLHATTGSLTSSFRRASISIQTGIGWLDRLAVQSDRASMMMWKFSMAAMSINQVGITMGAVAVGFGAVTKRMIDSFSMVDRIKRQFGAIYQSAELGGKMVDQLVNDAVKIRYTVEQVLEAGRLLALEGFDPKKLIYDMADLAAGVNQEGITIVNATRAFVDATNGQFRRLKETFQITREDAMAFAPDAFAGPNNQISNQAKATDAIIRAIKAKYRGMNDATMQTIQGMLSNVDDALVKSMAKMGQAIEGTVTGWLKKIMDLLNSLGKFAETGLGKMTAQTILWTTVLSGALSVVALLTAGMIGLLGVFAAYKVFTQARGEGLGNVLKAELELMAVQQKVAEFEAIRSAQDIQGLEMRLALSKALYAEEQKKLSLTGVKISSDAEAMIGGRSLAELSSARRVAQAEVDIIAKPRELLNMNDNLLSVQEEIAAIEQTTLGTESERYAQLKMQEASLQRQLDLQRAMLADAEAIAVGGAGGRKEAVIAQQARADADALATQAAQEEIKATDLQVQSDLAHANVESLRERQLELTTAATEIETLAIEANTAAINANAESKLASFRLSEQQKIVGSLATSRDVEIYDVDTRILENQLEKIENRKFGKKTRQTTIDAHNLRVEKLEALIEQRKQKLPELESQAAIRQDQVQQLGDLEEEARLKKEAAITAAESRRATATAARENAAAQRAVNAELRTEERNLDRINGKLATQRQLAGQMQADAAAAAGVATAAEADAGIGPGRQPVNAAAMQGYIANRQARLRTLRRAELDYMGRVNDLSNIEVERDRLRLTQIQERIALRERELAVARGILATDEATAVVNGAGSVTSTGRGGRFRSGFSGGFGGVIGGAMSVADMVTGPLKGMFSGLAQAIGGAGGIVGLLGTVAGALAGLAVVIGPAVAAFAVFKYASNVHKEFIASIKDSIEALDKWAGLVKRSPAQDIATQEQASDLDILLKMKRGTIVTNLYKSLKDVDGMTLERMRSIISKIAYQGKLNEGGTVEEAEKARARWAHASTEELKKFIATNDQLNMIIQGMGSDLDAMNASVVKQGIELDANARRFAEQKLAVGGLSEEERKFYQSIVDSTEPAKQLSQYMHETFKNAEDTMPDVDGLADYLDKAAESGKTDAEAQAELAANAESANKSVQEMEQAKADLLAVGQNLTAEEQKALDTAKERSRVLNSQIQLYQTIKQLLSDQNNEALMSASGMGNTDAIFGADIAAGEWAAAATETDPKKRRERLQNALKAARGSREGTAKQALDLYAPGPTASPEEKAAYERYKGQVEQQRMAGVEDDYRRAMAAGNMTPEQRARAETQIAAERRTSANAIAGFNKNAADIEFQQMIGGMEAGRAGAAVGGASAQQLAQLDMDILRVKMQQAKANNDITEQMNLQVQAAQLLKGLQESALGDEEAKLAYMQEQADQGLISQEAVDAEKRQLAQMYMDRARSAAAGSAEYYQNMQKALQLLGDDTKDQWKGIVGEIIGAPAALVSRVASEGWISRKFADAVNYGGIGDKMKADIVSQTNRTITVNVNWDNLNAVDGRVQAAITPAMAAFAKEFTYQIGAA